MLKKQTSFAQVLKFNPNHDPSSGRFSSSGGGGGASQDEQNKALWAKARHQPAPGYRFAVDKQGKAVLDEYDEPAIVPTPETYAKAEAEIKRLGKKKP